MIARVALAMVVYVVVGMVLAVGQAVRVPEDVVVTATGKSAARPADTLPVQPARDLLLAAQSTTTTSTVPWASGRLIADGASGDEVPVAIEIPAIHVVAEVVETGVDPESLQMAIPASPAEVGWYEFGPRPGEPGSAVLAGHVDVAGYGPGAFFELDRLAPGNEVVIHMSDGSTREFEVIETTRVPKEDLDVDAVFQNSGPARVTLITCGGAFNQTERTYLDNVVSSLAPIRAGA